jgi:hypothetical protein
MSRWTMKIVVSPLFFPRFTQKNTRLEGGHQQSSKTRTAVFTGWRS